MEKHGLAAWGDTARECYENLRTVIEKADEFVKKQAKGEHSFGATSAPALQEVTRREIATALLPVVRGEMTRGGWPCVLHLDSSPKTLDAIGGEAFPEIAARGVMTPEHILRAGVRPLVVRLDLDRGVGARHPTKPAVDPQPAQHAVAATSSADVDASPLQRTADLMRNAIKTYRRDYDAYANRHGQEPITDFLKTIIIPGVGIVYAGKDRRSALIAADCYGATMQAMSAHRQSSASSSSPRRTPARSEYWPLERRKIEESAKSRRDLDGKVAVVIGAASGIGRATALLAPMRAPPRRR
jgi:rhamnose utilization protein RhaD (predicted bifunctional aldolase and dehydrogenase)